MTTNRTLCATALLASLLGCVDGADGDPPPPDQGRLGLDRSVGDSRPPQIWEPDREAGVMRADRFILERDAGTVRCLSEGAGLDEVASPLAIAQARGLQADLDLDADGRPDLAVKTIGPDGVQFLLYTGEPLAEWGRLALPGAVDAELMPALWPRPAGPVAPIHVGGDQRGLVALETRAEGVQGLRVFNTEGRGLRFIELPRGVARLQLLNTGAGWRALVDEAQGGCALYAIERDAPLGEWPDCRLEPGWDANGDRALDVVRSASAGVTILDGPTGETILQRPAPPRLGYAPVVAADGAPGPGPIDLRGAGPELIGIAEDRGLRLTYHEPLDLLPAEQEPQIVAGNHLKYAFWLSPAGLRLWTENDRNGLRTLQIFELGSTLRPRGEIGPFRALSWSLGPDVDRDGYPEVQVLGGSSPDGENTPVRFLAVRDGQEVFAVAAERNARFDVRWAPGGQPYDLDGCPGDERVVVRRGNRAPSGLTPTRLLITNAAGARLWTGPPVDSATHQVVAADLDGDGQAELIELLALNPEEASLTVWHVSSESRR